MKKTGRGSCLFRSFCYFSVKVLAEKSFEEVSNGFHNASEES